jgi:hypothetical protein
MVWTEDARVRQERSAPLPTPPTGSSSTSARRRTSTSASYRMDGTENPYAIWRELGEWMTQHVTVER